MSRSAPLRRLTSLLAVALVALLALSGTAAARDKCYPRGSTTIVVNSKLRIFKRSKGADVYGCVLRSKRVPIRVLSGARRSSDPANARLTSHVSIYGYYAAWTTRSVGAGPVGISDVTNRVYARNLLTGATPDGLPRQVGAPGCTVDCLWVRDIVVLPSGATAWAVFDDDDSSYIQGFDRANHDPDLLSDDQRTLPSRPKLHSLNSKTITWSYADGSKGTKSLF